MYADLLFSKVNNDLVLLVGDSSNELILQNWYASASNHSVGNLQMVVEAGADYNAASSDSLLSKKVAEFSFTSLVNSFDAARTADPALTTWAVSSALTSAFLSSSDTAALGGDLAYQYGHFGGLDKIGSTGAINVLGASTFGTQLQTFQTPAASAAGTQLAAAA